jgi:hypothetical protein
LDADTHWLRASSYALSDEDVVIVPSDGEATGVAALLGEGVTAFDEAFTVLEDPGDALP